MKLPYEILRIEENIKTDDTKKNENANTGNQVDDKNKEKEYLFNLGDIVTISSNPLLEKNRNSLYGIEKRVATPPFMVVTEVAKREKQKNKFKLKCQYYCHKQMKFVENYFDSESIIRISPLNKLQKYIEKTNQLKTKQDDLAKEETASKKIEIEEKIKKIKKTLNEWESWFPKDTETTQTYLLQNLGIQTVVFKTLFLEDAFRNTSLIRQGQLLSPFMTVKAIEMEKGDNNIYDKQTGKVIREVSLYKVKCIWYNPIECKFSEDWFIPEALISIEEDKQEPTK